MAVSVSTPRLDSYVRSDFPDQSFATNTLLRVLGGTAPAPRILSYLWGVPPDMPRGAQVLEATLTLTQQYDQTGGRTLTVHRVGEKFDVQRVTWNTIPQVVGQDSVSVTKGGPIPRGTKWVVDVTSHMQAIANGEPWWGWRLSTSSSIQPPLAFHSSEAAESLRPVLRVRWTAAPQAPRALTPGHDQVVAVPRPVLRWEHIDVVGDTSLMSVRVQINSADSWASPAWDSGEVPFTLPQLDLNAAGYGGIPSGGTVWWRAQQRDGAGLWSAWSDAVRITYKPPVTLTITQPSTPTVEQVAPTVSWDVTGGAQTAWRVLVYRLPSLVEVWDSGRRAGTAKTTQIPATAFYRDDRSYRVEVRVWDDQQRVATPGVPVWRSATFDFIRDQDGSLTPPTGLTAATDRDQVAVTLSWRRATAPEGWVITRDGGVIAHVDAADVAGPEGSSVFVDYGARPRVPHVYGVAPVINGKVGPPLTLTTDADLLHPEGLWLVDPADGQRVMLHGDGIGEWGLAEQTTVHEPLGAPQVVPVYRALGGARGSLSGELMDTEYGVETRRTAAEWADAWLDLRARPGRTLRLVGADRNIPVVLWGMTEAPAPVGEHMMSTVAASWCQVGEHEGGPR